MSWFGDGSDFYFDIPKLTFTSGNQTVNATGGSTPTSSGGGGSAPPSAASDSPGWLNVFGSLANIAKVFYDDVSNHDLQSQMSRNGQQVLGQAQLQGSTFGSGGISGNYLVIGIVALVLILLLKK